MAITPGRLWLTARQSTTSSSVIHPRFVQTTSCRIETMAMPPPKVKRPSSKKVTKSCQYMCAEAGAFFEVFASAAASGAAADAGAGLVMSADAGAASTVSTVVVAVAAGAADISVAAGVAGAGATGAGAMSASFADAGAFRSVLLFISFMPSPRAQIPGPAFHPSRVRRCRQPPRWPPPRTGHAFRSPAAACTRRCPPRRSARR